MGFLNLITKKLFQFGVKAEMPLLLQQRIRASNQLVIVIFFLGLLSIVLFSLRANIESALASTALLGASILIVFFNYLGLHQLGRLILSIAPALMILYLNISLKFTHPEQVDMIHYISPRMLLISTIVLPLILFTAGETFFLLLAVLAILSSGFWVYDWLHIYLGIYYDDLGLAPKNYNLIYEDGALLIITLVGAMMFFRSLNRGFARQTNQLISETQIQNQTLNAQDEQLRKTLEAIEKNHELEKNRAWEAQGLARFARLLRSKGNENKMYQVLLSGIIKYVDAKQGALFILNDKSEPKTLDLMACYALNKNQYLEKSFIWGEGLVGQVAKSGKMEDIRNLPPDYPKIILGMTEIMPRTLLVLPLKFNEKVEGVLELSNLQEWEAYQIHFLEKLGENIGAMIAGFKSNERDKILLAEAQKMSAEFQKREEFYLAKIQELENLLTVNISPQKK